MEGGIELKAPAIMHYVSWMKRLGHHRSDYAITYRKSLAYQVQTV